MYQNQTGHNSAKSLIVVSPNRSLVVCGLSVVFPGYDRVVLAPSPTDCFGSVDDPRIKKCGANPISKSDTPMESMT
jgi:hypothetical protein